MIDARSLTLALNGRWHGRYGAAPCPVCQPEGRKTQNALTIAEGRSGLLLHCKKSDCDFRDVAAAAGIAPGDFAPPDPLETMRREAERRAHEAKRAEHAERLWLASKPIEGTIAERYLRGRGITCALPPTLRFKRDCFHSWSGKWLPAVVALVEGGEGFAVHRTFLAADGAGKASVETNKAMLGQTAGGAVRLSESGGRIVVAEGIETALSLLCGLLDGPAEVWAALSTSGLRGLSQPPVPGFLTIAADGDRPGQDAAYDLAERAAAYGWQVSVLPAPDGADWNDILTGKAVLA